MAAVVPRPAQQPDEVKITEQEYSVHKDGKVTIRTDFTVVSSKPIKENKRTEGTIERSFYRQQKDTAPLEVRVAEVAANIRCKLQKNYDPQTHSIKRPGEELLEISDKLPVAIVAGKIEIFHGSRTAGEEVTAAALGTDEMSPEQLHQNAINYEIAKETLRELREDYEDPRTRLKALQDFCKNNRTALELEKNFGYRKALLEELESAQQETEKLGKEKVKLSKKAPRKAYEVALKAEFEAAIAKKPGDKAHDYTVDQEERGQWKSLPMTVPLAAGRYLDAMTILRNTESHMLQLGATTKETAESLKRTKKMVEVQARELKITECQVQICEKEMKPRAPARGDNDDERLGHTMRYLENEVHNLQELEKSSMTTEEQEQWQKFKKEVLNSEKEPSQLQEKLAFFETRREKLEKIVDESRKERAELDKMKQELEVTKQNFTDSFILAKARAQATKQAFIDQLENSGQAEAAKKLQNLETSLEECEKIANDALRTAAATKKEQALPEVPHKAEILTRDEAIALATKKKTEAETEFNRLISELQEVNEKIQSEEPQLQLKDEALLLGQQIQDAGSRVTDAGAELARARRIPPPPKEPPPDVIS